MRLHREEAASPGSVERYELARRDDPDGPQAAVLRAEAWRRRRVLAALCRVVARLPPGALRRGLQAVPQARAPPGEGASELERGFYLWLNPGALSLEDYERLEKMLDACAE